MLGSGYNKSSIDYPLVFGYAFLVVLGLMMIHSAGRPPEGYEEDLAEMLFTPVGKQFIWFIISMGAWFFINHFADRQLWIVGAYPIYAITLILLVLVALLGKEINGARSWFSLAGFTFQPSELAKFGTCLAMAAYLSQWGEKINKLSVMLGGVALWAVPSVLILGQPDLGSAVVFSSFLLVMYREGLSPLLLVFGFFTIGMFILGILQAPPILMVGLLCIALFVLGLLVPRRKRWWTLGAACFTAAAIVLYLMEIPVWGIILGLTLVFGVYAAYHTLRQNGRLAALVSGALIWGCLVGFAANFTFFNVLRPHQQDRFNAWLRPEGMDSQGALYNVLQSKLAIAAGGLKGKGLWGGTMTRFDYVPAQNTDFIFCTIAEEQGFLGSTVVILTFLFLMWRISQIAERQKRPFVRAYAYGILGILLIHVVVNIGMTMGVMPVIGIPLPFMSKGGSSLLCFTIMLAVLLKLDKHREAVG
ncbi:rod shape-determining protein RodA [Lewinella sp. W8]|uniref:rod shape-determining protein RodA n=1 Tax=Lewinella sp. W8 TaxID=2528208 RepID=UPI0010679CAB|nr:rod shape-determining protein RodA [Lewinella sp. W8]MTB52672.1 rod shape-determining protein RodA [Lewinella sp. W8]